MKLKYAIMERSPICLHALGQPLVNALWREARELIRQRNALRHALYECMTEEGSVGMQEGLGRQARRLRAINRTAEDALRQNEKDNE